MIGLLLPLLARLLLGLSLSVPLPLFARLLLLAFLHLGLKLQRLPFDLLKLGALFRRQRPRDVDGGQYQGGGQQERARELHATSFLRLTDANAGTGRMRRATVAGLGMIPEFRASRSKEPAHRGAGES